MLLGDKDGGPWDMLVDIRNLLEDKKGLWAQMGSRVLGKRGDVMERERERTFWLYLLGNGSDVYGRY